MLPRHVQVNHLSHASLRAIDELVTGHIPDIFPAAAFVILQNGSCLLDAAYGWIDPDYRLYEVTQDTIFDLASVSKLFTATAFLSFVSEGKVTLDDPLVSVIPEFGAVSPRSVDGGQDPHTKQPLPLEEDMRNVLVDAAQVTFRHLLLHTSGLAAWRAVYAAAGPPPVPPDQPEIVSREQRWLKALHALCNYPFVGIPGDKVCYSDIGLMLLGEATARLNGSPGDLQTAVRQRVLQPLALERVVYNPMRQGFSHDVIVPTENDPTWRKRRAWGEVHDENACGVGGIAGHAGLFAHANAVATFGQAWLDGAGMFGIDTRLAQESTREQVNYDGVRRGFGWALKAHTDSAAGAWMSADTFGHTGFTGTSLFIDPQRALVIACLTNRVYPGRHQPGIHEFRRAFHDSIVEAVD